MTLSPKALDEHWWITNLPRAVCEIDKGGPSAHITSDASGLGWGGGDLMAASILRVDGTLKKNSSLKGME